jgi:hypothetical protein
VDAVPRLLNTPIPFWIVFAVDWRVALFAAVLAAVTALAFGLIPALLLCGGVYFLATLLPGLRSEWASMDEQRHDDAVGDVARS